jgi:hypothetical protein
MEKYRQGAQERMKFTTLIVKEDTHSHNDFKIIHKNGGKLNESSQFFSE